MAEPVKTISQNGPDSLVNVVCCSIPCPTKLVEGKDSGGPFPSPFMVSEVPKVGPMYGTGTKVRNYSNQLGLQTIRSTMDNC